MTYQQIRYDVAEGIVTLSLNRPEKLNAFTLTMHGEMMNAFDQIDADDEVRAVIVTGTGRAFCAGADVSGGISTFDLGSENPDSPIRPDGTADYSRESARDGGGILALRMFKCLKPIIAAINGAAVGIGATMTLPMDIRLASENAKFGFVFARRGIVPEAASSWFLPRVVGVSQALEWCFSGRVFPAKEALAGGLIKALYAPDDLLPAARAIAEDIVRNASPVSVSLIRQMMWRGLGMDDPMEAHKIDSRGILSRGRSADVAEGINSFFEKRLPHFPDRVSKDMPDYFPWWRERQYV